MNHSMTRPSLLRKAVDAFDRGAFSTSAKYTLEISERQSQALEAAHIALATRLARLEYLTAAQFNRINRLYARSDADWFNRLFCAHRSGDVATATTIRARHTGSPYLHLIDFLNAALSGSFVAAAEYEHLFKFANNSPSFPYRRFIRLEQGKHLQNGILALVDGLGEILMAINILKHDGELASSVHTIATPERYHPVVRLLMPSANVVTPERLAPHTELTYSSDLIFSHFQSGRALKPIQRLPQNSGRKLVGIAWRGGAGEVGKSGEGPRAASLESLLALLPAGDFTYVSLQYNITPEEKQLLSKQAAVKGTNFNVAKDHVNLLKLCSGMSGIVSVEGSSIHIAGQFGIPVLALMPPVAQFSDGWQWYLDSQFTPPYDRLRPCSREQRAEAISAWLCDIGLL